MRLLPRDLPAVTTSSPAPATSSASRRAITATWSAIAWTAATKSDVVSNDENFSWHFYILLRVGHRRKRAGPAFG